MIINQTFFKHLAERLLPIERDYFLWLNNNDSPFWDTFMYLYSDKMTWLPLGIVFAILIFYKTQKKEAFLLVVCAVIIGMLCDFVPAEYIKPFFARLRPSHHPDFKDIVCIVLDKRGGSHGFISNHAANGFGIAIFTSLLFRYRYFTATIYMWVLITSYSRIYLGVHFITDILGGLVWGTLCGYLVYVLYQLFRQKVFKIEKERLPEPILSNEKAQILIGVIFLTILYIVIRGFFFRIS